MKSVLFVDNNQLLSRLSCDILQREGYRAVPASNAAEALEAVNSQSFDVVVTDVGPKGVNGLELARKISAQRPKVPIIMVTAHGPVQAKYIKACLRKDKLFPTLLDTIRGLGVEP